jgi:nucleosome binding factor SPN SPT16 subunit
MEVPADYDGPKLEIILRTVKPVDNTDEVIGTVLSQVKAGGKVAIYQKDATDGDLTEKTLKGLAAAGLSRGEMKELTDKVHLVKIESEIENMKTAAKFIKWTFDNIVNEIEDIVEVEKKIKHSQISTKVEKMLEREDTIKKFLGKFEPASRPD